MTRLLAVGLVSLAIGTVSADSRFPPILSHPGDIRVSDPRGGNPCVAWTAVEQVARQTDTIIGFENLPQCMLGPSSRDAQEPALSLSARTARQAFDAIATIRPEFSWRLVGDTIVIRPAAAWRDQTDVLNRRVEPFSERGAHPHLVLHRLLQAVQPSLFQPHTDLRLSSAPAHRSDATRPAAIDAAVSVEFGGGTLVDALNAVAKASGTNWQAGFENGRMHVALHSMSFDGGSTTIVTAPVGSNE